jgi:hypothetical protein
MQLLSPPYVHALICFNTSVRVSSRHSGSSYLLEASNEAYTAAGRWSTDSLSSAPVPHRVRFEKIHYSVARSFTCVDHVDRVLDGACIMTELETLVIGATERSGRTCDRRRHQRCTITVQENLCGVSTMFWT